VLHERGMSLNYVPYIQTSLHLRPGEVYSHLSVFYHRKHLLSLQSSIPGLMSFAAKTTVEQAAYFSRQYAIADAAILSVVDNILECPYQGHLGEIYIGHLCVELLLLALVKITTATPTMSGLIVEEDTKRVYRAKELLLQDMGHDMSLASLAEQMGISVYKLNHGFKSVYGIGAAEYLMEARMKKAHHALAETEAPIAVIARECGYSHPHAFALTFKKYFGYTPAFVQKSSKVQG
jgi:AraC-like DNA-binding protein